MKYNADITNIALILISCVVAFIFPFELVLLSYAFLGPAHYLTQISWMHDRNYFTDQKGIWPIAAALSALIVATIYLPTMGGNITIYGLYTLAISGATSLFLAPKLWQRLTITSILSALFMIAGGYMPEFVLGLILLLPTVVHIYIFTGCFMLYGALSSQSLWGKLSFATYVLCGGIFIFLTPHDYMVAPSYVANNIEMFDNVANYLADLLSFNGWIDGVAMLGFLSFAYTYHYLNWFSKVNIIKWHDAPKHRLISIGVLYLCSIALYLYDYKIGFGALLFLSILHVILEFPLNILTFKNLGRMIIPAKSA